MTARVRLVKVFCVLFLGVLAVSILLNTQNVVYGQNSEIRVSFRSDIITLDPHLVRQPPDYPLSMNIFEGLVRYKQGPDAVEIELEPDLAKSWDVSEDGTVYTFYLREGIMFQKNYGELTAEDVKFSLERHLDPAFGSAHRSSMEQMIDKIEVIDRYTVRITLKRVHADFFSGVLAYRPGYIVSKKAVEELGIDFGVNPVGTGPYQFVSRVPGERLILESFEDYWRGPGKIKRVIFSVIPEEMTAALALVAGDLDMMMARDPEVYAFLKTQETVKVEDSVVSSNYRGLFINLDRVKDVRVRQALAYALDLPLIVDKIWGELADPPLPTVLPPTMFGHKKDLPRYDYNPEKAKNLLEEAGYKEGELVLEIISRDRDAPWMLAAASYIEEIGISTEVDVLEAGALLARRDTGNWDLYGFGMGRTSPSSMIEMFHSDGIPTANFTYYDAVDDLIEGYIGTLDPDKQKEYLYALQDRMAEDLPAIPVLSLKLFTATRNSLKGDTPNTHYDLALFYHMYYEELSSSS